MQAFNEQGTGPPGSCSTFDSPTAKTVESMKKYFSEKNALTVMTSIFCLVMTLIAATRQSMWEAIAFALAFSFSIELLCHRVKENK